MFELLSRDEIQMLHVAAMEVLERTEIVIQHEKALRILEDAGAKVDFKKKIVKIPEFLVHEAFKKLQAGFS